MEALSFLRSSFRNNSNHYINTLVLYILLYLCLSRPRYFSALAPKELSEKQNSNKSIWIVINSDKRSAQKIETTG